MLLLDVFYCHQGEQFVAGLGFLMVCNVFEVAACFDATETSIFSNAYGSPAVVNSLSKVKELLSASQK